MDDRLRDLYKIPKHIVEQEVDLLALSQQVDHLEERLRQRLAHMAQQDRDLIEEYLSLRNDLEVLSIKQAIRFGKRQAAPMRLK